MNQSQQIHSLFLSDQPHDWQEGYSLFNKGREAERFFMRIEKAIQGQVAHCGVEEGAIDSSELYHIFSEKIFELIKLNQSFVDFMRTYYPGGVSTVWWYVLSGRIMPNLGGFSRDERRKPKPQVLVDEEKVSAEPSREMEEEYDVQRFEQMLDQALKGLPANRREILLLDIWKIIPEILKDKYREMVIARGVANRRGNNSNASELSLYRETITEFGLGEIKLKIQGGVESENLIKIEESLTKHFLAFKINGEKKQQQAKRFDRLGGLNEIAPPDLAKTNKLIRNIPRAWFRSPKIATFEVCRLAAEEKISKKALTEAFHSYFPLPLIYPKYDGSKKGTITVRCEPLAVLKEFSILCRSQAYHYKAYLHCCEKRDALKTSLGMDNVSISKILDLTPQNVSVIRFRTRQWANLELAHLDTRPQADGEKVEAMSSLDSVCSDYKPD
ncbi:MAG: hypothetical protein RLY14_226 [Planctomycetota bacterium]